jgi:integrase
MPRDPFLTAARSYLNEMRAYWTELTVEQRRRDLAVIASDLWALRKNGKLRNVRPDKISEADVGALLYHWRTRATRGRGPNAGRGILDVNTQRHLFGVLRKFLEWNGNGVIARLEARGHARFPRAIEKDVEVLGTQDLEQLRRAADAIDGWSGDVARFLVGFCPATGLRPKEVRLANLADVDVSRGRILVRHPKGEGSWAATNKEAIILPSGREVLAEFLASRSEYLARDPCEALIPYRRRSGQIGPWSAAMLRKVKADLERISGVRFHLKTFRATFGQNAIDAGARIEAVSRAMRHKSTKTTEAFYARIRADRAFQEIEAAFNKPAVGLVLAAPGSR